jgi:hypothetical protein
VKTLGRSSFGDGERSARTDAARFDVDGVIVDTDGWNCIPTVATPVVGDHRN